VLAAKSVISFKQAPRTNRARGRSRVGMERAISRSVVLDLSNKLAKYLGEGTSRRAAEGNFRCFSFWCWELPAAYLPPLGTSGLLQNLKPLERQALLVELTEFVKADGRAHTNAPERYITRVWNSPQNAQVRPLVQWGLGAGSSLAPKVPLNRQSVEHDQSLERQTLETRTKTRCGNKRVFH
jgi:hypothetical protein